MTEHIDVYADSFTITTNPFGACISFQLSPPHPDPSNPLPPTKVATIRMSIEHAKTMAVVMRRQIMQFEEQMGIQVPVPSRILSQLGIGLEDWEAFWGMKPGRKD